MKDPQKGSQAAAQDNSMADLLKWNFKVKNPVKDEPKSESTAEGTSILQEVRKRVLGTLGGSMVYVEREKLTWDGEESSDAEGKKS